MLIHELDIVNCHSNDSDLYFSCLAYLRQWYATDGVWLNAIKKQNGFDRRLLRRMAIEYNVNRGICADSTNISDEKRNDFKLCNLLTRWQANWPIGLTDRARRCCDFAKQGIEENVFSKKQFSAVTKFMWFLEPSEWTVFDKYAAIGLGVKGITLELKMLAFYSKLEDKNFVGLCSRMQTILNESVFAELPATRILDKFFMMQGDPNFAERTRSEANLFVTLLPVSLANDLKTLGIEIQRQFGNQARKLCE